ncbi:MAG: hypothetical protein NUK54_11285, partial [Methanothrix sp.]|nr:hypothetical protein [Methanothrix sp.]
PFFTLISGILKRRLNSYMTFSFILITFFTGLLGIKTGKYLTKTNLLAILQKEITNYDFITQKNQTSLFKKTLMCLAYTNILHIMKDTEEIEEWSFNISSLIYLGVTIIVSIYIRHTIEYMFEIIDLL